MKKRSLIVLCAVLVLVGLLTAWVLLRDRNSYGKIFSGMNVSDVEKLGIFSNTRPLREAELDAAETEQLVSILHRLELPPSELEQPDYKMVGAGPISFMLHIRLKDGTDLIMNPMEYRLSARRQDRYYLLYPQILSYGPNNSVPERFGDAKLYSAEEDAAFSELMSHLSALHEKYFP